MVNMVSTIVGQLLQDENFEECWNRELTSKNESKFDYEPKTELKKIL